MAVSVSLGSPVSMRDTTTRDSELVNHVVRKAAHQAGTNHERAGRPRRSPSPRHRSCTTAAGRARLRNGTNQPPMAQPLPKRNRVGSTRSEPWARYSQTTKATPARTYRVRAGTVETAYTWS